MPIKVHDLKPAPGSKRPKRRVGRGIAGKGGKTAGRGMKGQGARDTIKPGFEGGQLLGERAKAAGVSKVVFDRGGFLYHGRVAALADAAREAGLEF